MSLVGRAPAKLHTNLPPLLTSSDKLFFPFFLPLHTTASLSTWIHNLQIYQKPAPVLKSTLTFTYYSMNSDLETSGFIVLFFREGKQLFTAAFWKTDKNREVSGNSGIWNQAKSHHPLDGPSSSSLSICPFCLLFNLLTVSGWRALSCCLSAK